MAWNEPGGSGDKDPWGGRKDEQGPPDLDEVVRKLQNKLGGLFGGKRGGGDGSGSSPSGGGVGFGGIFAMALVLLVLFGLYDGVYVIDQSQRGVKLFLGEYSGTMEPGMNFYWPRPVGKVEKVNVTQVKPELMQAQLLTKDLNLIQIDLEVQFKVKDEKNYLFEVREPNLSLIEGTESALRQVVGGMTMDDIMRGGGGRNELVNETEKQIQTLLDKYNTGLEVTKVNLKNTQPPEEVQAAFQDAIKAEEDENTLKNKAQAYANDILPKAEGDAERMIQQAEAYKQQTISNAMGEASRFSKVLTEYRKAPAVTRKRLYLETVELMLANSSKVMIKMKQGNSLMYLPIDKLMQIPKSDIRAKSTKPSSRDTEQAVTNGTSRSSTTNIRSDLRERSTR